MLYFFYKATKASISSFIPLSFTILPTKVITKSFLSILNLSFINSFSSNVFVFLKNSVSTPFIEPCAITFTSFLVKFSFINFFNPKLLQNRFVEKK